MEKLSLMIGNSQLSQILQNVKFEHNRKYFQNI